MSDLGRCRLVTAKPETFDPLSGMIEAIGCERKAVVFVEIGRGGPLPMCQPCADEMAAMIDQKRKEDEQP